MNGKQAKLLRKLGRDDKASKRAFHTMDHVTKGTLRTNVTAALAAQEAQTEQQTQEVSE